VAYEKEGSNSQDSLNSSLVELKTNQTSACFYRVTLRPGVTDFLKKLCEDFKLLIYSADIRSNAIKLAEKLEALCEDTIFDFILGKE